MRTELSILVGRESPLRESVTDFIERGGRTVANRPAVRHGSRVLTYADLFDRSTRLAGHLRARGAGPDAPVGLLLPRGIDFAVALLAVLKTRAAAVPFDPTHPAHRRRVMGEAARVAMTIVDSSGIVDDGLAGDTVDLADPAWQRADPADAGQARAEDTAYILFTSGSTGVPKGVRMPHRALANVLGWQRTASRATTGTRTLHFAPLVFDVCLQETLATWVSGGEVVVLDESRRHDIEYTARLCAEAGIGRLFQPYAALQPLADWVAYAGLSLPHLTEVITAGEQPLVTEALEGFIRLCAPRARLANQYGPTEAHVVTEAVYVGDPAHWPRLPHAGHPIDNCVTAILDESGAVTALGEEGEVCVTGAPTGLGYLGDEPGFGPVAALDGQWGYRTGDRARIEDGNLVLLGRRDDQVKVSGYRIELREVEAVASAVAPVSEVAAVALGRPGPERRLGLFLVPGRGRTIDPSAVRAGLAARLPEAAVPSRIEVLDALPRTRTGKIDRARLRASSEQAPVGQAPIGQAPIELAPKGEAPEWTIARTYAAVTHTSTVDIHGSFLDLGGTSLQAMMAVSRLTRALHATPPIARVLSTATATDLAADLRAGRWSVLPRPASQPTAATMPTRIQQEMWAATELEEPTAYNVIIALDAERRIDPAALIRALRRTVSTHSALRSLLRFDHGAPVVQHPTEWWVDVELADAADDETAAQLEAVFAEREYDLAHDIPVRAMVIRRPDDDLVLIGLHHHAVDEEGIRRVVDDLVASYPLGPDQPLPPDAAAVAPRIVDDPGDVEHWTAALSGVRDDMVTWLQRTDAVPSGRATFLATALPHRPEPPAGVTLYGWLLATFAQAAHDSGAPAELLIGAVSSRRDPVADAGLVGCYTGLLPVHLTVAPDLAETTVAAQRSLLSALSHRQFSYSDVAAGRTIVAATVALEAPEGRPVCLGDVPVRLRTVRPPGTPFPLTGALRPHVDGSAVLELDFDAGRYPPATARALLDAWRAHVMRE